MGLYDRDYMRASAEPFGSRWLWAAIGGLAVVAGLLYFRQATWFPPPGDWPKPKLLDSKTVPLGYFEVVSGEIAICDPGYDRTLVTEGAIAFKVGKVPNGNWQARVVLHTVGTPDHVCCAELLAFPAASPLPDSPSWEMLHPDIGVDSGQAGFFDWQHFRSPAVIPRDHPWKGKMLIPEDPWYSLCCDVTLSGRHAGVIPFGAVSSSGWGDGGYPVYHLRDAKGQVAGLRLVFLSKDEYEAEEKKEPEPDSGKGPKEGGDAKP